MLIKDFLKDPHNDNELTLAIIDIIREPLLILDEDMRVVMASHSFYAAFEVDPKETTGKDVRTLGDGQWDIPGLRTLLEKIIPQQRSVVGYEVIHEFPHIGRRVMLLNAQQIWFESLQKKHVLLSIFDVTERRNQEENVELLHQKDLLMREMQHRMANNLQIITSILLLKGESLESPELKAHLTDTHNRIMTIVEIQKHLQHTGLTEHVRIRDYLTDLCNGITKSMIDEEGPVSLHVESADRIIDAAKAVLIGLITTELVINALKYAFKGRKEGLISVGYESEGEEWGLTVADNGVGISPDTKVGGLGTEIIESFARQLKAVVEVRTGPQGTTTTIICRA